MKDFDKILTASKELNDFRFFDADQEWSRFLAATGIGGASPESGRVVNLDAERSTDKQILYMLAFAASMILIFAAIFVFRSESPSSAVLAAGSTPQKLGLTDGSNIEVAAGSKLTYYTNLEHSDLREVRLEGDATFDVAGNILPFRVYHKDIFIDVLGTEFSITGSSDGVLIKNTRGSVKVSETKNPANNITMVAGDAFLYRDGVFTDINKPVVVEEPEPVVVAAPVKKQEAVTKKPEPVTQPAPAEPAPVSRRFKLESVIKDYLLKFNKKKLKVDKSNKPDFEKIVSIDNIDKPYFDLLQDLKNQGVIDFEKGDCPDCYIIKAPAKKQ